MQQGQQRIDVTIFQRDARWRPISTSLLQCQSLLDEKHKSLRTKTNTTLLHAQSHGEEGSRFRFRGRERERDGTSTFCVTSFPHLLRMFPAQFPQAKLSVERPTPTF